MKQVIQSLRRTDVEKRIPVLWLELDYELATLHDALQSNDEELIKLTKQKLEMLRQELLQLEA